MPFIRGRKHGNGKHGNVYQKITFIPSEKLKELWEKEEEEAEE